MITGFYGKMPATGDFVAAAVGRLCSPLGPLDVDGVARAAGRR